MRINATERRLLACTAACLLLCFGFFFGTNQITRGVRIQSDASSQSPAVSNEHLLVSEGELRVDLNKADKDALVRLPGIGEVLAQRILDYRAAYGNFHSVQELTKVEGIGEKTLAKLLNYITVEGTK